MFPVSRRIRPFFHMAEISLSSLLFLQKQAKDIVGRLAIQACLIIRKGCSGGGLVEPPQCVILVESVFSLDHPHDLRQDGRSGGSKAPHLLVSISYCLTNGVQFIRWFRFFLFLLFFCFYTNNLHIYLCFCCTFCDFCFRQCTDFG